MIYLGLMSGTSSDGFDIAAITLEPHRLIAHETIAYAPSLQARILDMAIAPTVRLEAMGALHRELGVLYARAVAAFIDQHTLRDMGNIAAIGLHGPTIRHGARHAEGAAFSLQLGHPADIAATLNIPVVADVRMSDIALGGEGAPLAPLFHRYLLPQGSCVVNIGGIANITVLGDAEDATVAFDSGPGNTLMDAYARAHNLPDGMDTDGALARAGTINTEILAALLADAYFEKLPPKSTGREYFNLAWLAARAPTIATLTAPDALATLTELTAITIANAITETLGNKGNNPRPLYLVGGGTRNAYLIARFNHHIKTRALNLTAHPLPIPAASIEAAAWAYFAYARLNHIPLDTASITGAQRPAILGGLWHAASSSLPKS